MNAKEWQVTHKVFPLLEPKAAIMSFLQKSYHLKKYIFVRSIRMKPKFFFEY